MPGAGRAQRCRQDHADETAAGPCAAERGRVLTWVPTQLGRWRPGAFRLGFLPETIAFDAAITAARCWPSMRASSGWHQSAEPLFERVGLAAAAGRRVGTYSKACSMLGFGPGPARPAAADAARRADHGPRSRAPPLVLRADHRAHERRGHVLLSSHALSEMEARTDRVAILQRGRLIACGSLADLRRQGRGCPCRCASRCRCARPGASPNGSGMG